MSDQPINLVIALREAQRADEDRRTRSTVQEREKCETRVDNWIQNYFADRIQLELWTRSVKGTEEPGAYNVTDETKTQQGAGT